MDIYIYIYYIDICMIYLCTAAVSLFENSSAQLRSKEDLNLYNLRTYTCYIYTCM